MTRRGLIAGALGSPLLAQSGSATFAFVGSYTTAQRHGRGDGIHAYRIHEKTGEWTHVQQVGGLVNPSFLIASRDRRFLYSVHGDEAYATAFAVDARTGFLTELNRAATGGANGVHQALDPSGRFLVVANYAAGSVAVLPVAEDGRLGDQIRLIRLEGEPGPNAKEQAGSHPHHVVFDPSGQFVLVPDKGLDRIFVFRFDAETGQMRPAGPGFVKTSAGAGPRHLAFHPTRPLAWVANELESSLTTYEWDGPGETMRPLQTLSTLPKDFHGENTAAEIAVSRFGDFVYCSNRGHDSIAIYAVHRKTGLLRPAGWQSTQGKTPRYFGFDPSYRFLYACNEQGDTVVTFRVESTGQLMPTGQVVRNTSPVTIAFA